MKINGILSIGFTVISLASSFPALAEVIHCEGTAPYSEPMKMTIDYDSASDRVGRVDFTHADGSHYLSTAIGPFYRQKQDGIYIYTETMLAGGTTESPSAKSLTIQSDTLAGKDLKAMLSMPLSGFASIPMKCTVQGPAVPAAPVCPTAGKLNELLLQASQVGTPSDVETLLACGANINVKDERGCTPLLIVSDLGCGYQSHSSNDPLDPTVSSPPKGSRSIFDLDRLVSIMTRAGANIEARDPVTQQTALHKAAKYSNSNEVDLLAELGADVNAQDKEGNTPLILAATTGSVYHVKTILHFRPNRSIKNKRGQTAYDVAKELDAQDILSLLRPVSKTVTFTGGVNGGCTPTGMVMLDQGAEVELSFQASTTKMYKLTAPDLGIDLMAMPGETVRQTITPKTQGTFPSICGVHGAPDSQQTHGKIMVM